MTTYAEYEALPGVRWSDLKHMAKSPLHYRAALDGPRSDTAAMQLGRAAHCAVLEPLHLPEQFTVYDGARRGNDWTEFKEANEARDILTRPEWDTVLGIQAAVMAHPVASALLAGRGENELSVTWTDADTGLACKSRIDRLTCQRGKWWIVDFKTTADLDPRRFRNTVADLMYIGQLGMYRDGIGLARGIAAGAVIVAVESRPPHDVGVFRITPDDLWSGSDLFHDLLGRVAECEASGEWPGRYPERVDLDLPPWAFGDEDNCEAGAVIVGSASGGES